MIKLLCSLFKQNESSAKTVNNTYQEGIFVTIPTIKSLSLTTLLAALKHPKAYAIIGTTRVLVTNFSRREYR